MLLCVDASALGSGSEMSLTAPSLDKRSSRKQTAARLRRVLESHRDVKPIEDGWPGDPGIDQCGPQTRTAISERGHHGGVGSANHSKVQTDQRRNVGASLRHRSENLPDPAGGLDVSDADPQMPFALFAAASNPGRL